MQQMRESLCRLPTDAATISSSHYYLRRRMVQSPSCLHHLLYYEPYRMADFPLCRSRVAYRRACLCVNMGHPDAAVLAGVRPHMGRFRDCIHADHSSEHLAALRRRHPLPDSSNFKLWHTHQTAEITFYSLVIKELILIMLNHQTIKRLVYKPFLNYNNKSDYLT